MTIRRNAGWSVAGLLGAVLGIGALVFHLVILPRTTAAVQRHTWALARVLEKAATSGLVREQLQRLVEEIQREEPDLAYLLVVDPEGRALVHSDPARVGKVFDDPGTLAAARGGQEVEQRYLRDADEPGSPHHREPVYDVLVPLRDPGGALIGAANVGLRLRRVAAAHAAYRDSMAGLALGFLGLFALAWLGLSRGVLRPIEEVARAARAVGEEGGGGARARLPVARGDEIGALARDFATMDERVQRLLGEVRDRERELHALLDALPTFVFRLDVLGHLRRANAPALAASGASLARDAAPVLLWELPLWSPSSAERLRSAFGRALAGKVAELDEPVRLADGRSAWLSLTMRPVLDAAGRPDYVLCEGHDITGRRSAEEALLQSEARYRALAEAASDEIFIVGEDRRLVYANRALRAHRGLPADGPLAVTLDALWPEPVASTLAERVARLLTLGETQRTELQVRQGSAERWLDVVLVPVRASSAAAPLALGIARDITEAKVLQAKLLIADRMASLGLVAAAVAHEINNPLAYVLGNVELARDDLAEEPGLSPASRASLLQSLAEAEQGALRVRDIVRDLRLFSRGEREVRERVDVWEVLEAALRMAGNALRHRARLEAVVGGALPPVLASQGRLGQVFVNLLVNAAQAIPEGAAERNLIRVVARAEGEEVVVEIADSGCGIPPEQLAQLFTPFFTTKPAGEGTGLGLSICRNIVHSFGGRIEVESEAGQGTRMRVRLPADRGEAPLGDAPGSGPGTSAGARGRIVVIDDEESVGRVIESLLTRAGHEVVRFTDAREALSRLAAGERCDAIVCDLMMPQMTGAQFHRELAGVRPELVAEVIFVSGGAFSEEATRFRAEVERANPVLDKPFSAETLCAAVRRRLEARAGA